MSPNSTQDNRQVFVVYINPEDSVECSKKTVCVGDVTEVFCRNRTLCKKIRALPLFKMDGTAGKKAVVSSMALIACIDAGIQENLIIQNMGASEFVVCAAEKKPARLVVWGKVASVMLITFFGSIFAIMTYNQDVDVTGVFDRVYQVITGTVRTSPGILEWAYAFGVAFGIIIFFNHFGKRRLTNEPTPMEIEMEKYETDITNTLVKEASRKDQIIEKPKE
ncbi:MAG TPA: stage V sporulation protein AA [Candidatus Scybalocola faecigallinarum]|uniref:Stage V sporulation protein AA n=1 Tax=Candidatus Scybalocola faecigallinarum TaxID=2840941 RepID=A0A9D1F3K0_9FIRM|nr:stage V sporulation protein AA [Candidatus Scybalocola faecigallinarum]